VFKSESSSLSNLLVVISIDLALANLVEHGQGYIIDLVLISDIIELVMANFIEHGQGT